MCTPNFDQFRPLQHLKVEVHRPLLINGGRPIWRESQTTAVDETPSWYTRSLPRHEPAEAPIVTCQNSGGIYCTERTSIDMSVTRKPGDGEKIKSSVAFSVGSESAERNTGMAGVEGKTRSILCIESSIFDRLHRNLTFDSISS